MVYKCNLEMDIYRKYVWVIPWKDKKDIIITNSFQKVLNDLGLKSNRIWVGQGCEF